MSNQPDRKRREFLKTTAAGLLGGLVATRVLSNGAFAQAQGTPPGPLEMVKESDPQSQALGYVADARKADTKKFPKRKGLEGSKQFCYNCSFYQAKSKDPKSVKTAPCAIFANKGVAAMGWCNTWTENKEVKG